MNAVRRTALAAGGGALLMLGAAFAAVPLYRLFCQVTGFAGTTQRADAAEIAAPARVAATVLNVRFDANIDPAMEWRFKPAQVTQLIRVGERKLAFYKAVSTASSPTHGTAVFNVTPDTVGKYFVKIDCFCFQEQTLAAGQSVDMPVLYYIDPAFLNDPDAAKVEEITLSYTFFPVEAGPVRTALARPTPPRG